MRGITDTMREAEKVFQKAKSGKVWNREVEELKDFDTHYAEEHDKSVDNGNDVRDNGRGRYRRLLEKNIENSALPRFKKGIIAKFGQERWDDIKKYFPNDADILAVVNATIEKIGAMEKTAQGDRYVRLSELRDKLLGTHAFEYRLKKAIAKYPYQKTELHEEAIKMFIEKEVFNYGYGNSDVQREGTNNGGSNENRNGNRTGETLLRGHRKVAGGYLGNANEQGTPGSQNDFRQEQQSRGIRLETSNNYKEIDKWVEEAITYAKENLNNKNASISRSKQGGFSNAKDKAYMNAVSKYQNAKTDAEKTAALETLQKMVNEAAKEAGFENAIPEQTRAYTVRTKAAPKKTQKVYKVFTVDDNGRPSALFVSSTDTLPQNVWLDANDTFNFTDQSNGRKYIPSTKNPNSKGGATGRSIKLSDVSEADKAELERLGYIKKNKNGEYPKTITALAYRPGWHAGDLPFFPQGGKQGDGTTNYKNIHRYNQVVFECEMAADVDYTTTSTNSKGQVVFHDRQEMPTDGGYKFATNPMAKAQDIGSWYISGSLKIGRALTEAECNKILAKNGFKPQEWQAYGVGNDFVIGKLDLAKLGYTGEQFDAARKTLAPITYDDDGNVIPLSERFDADKDDIRYSVSVEDEETTPAKAEEVTSSWFDKLTNKFAKKMSLNADKIKTAARKEEPSIGLYDSIFGSPGRIAKRVAAFKPFFQMADKAMHKLTKLRSDYLKDLGKAMDIVKTDAERQDLTSILWMGDAEGKEYTDDELRENGATDNVIKAYRRVRSLIRRVGDALDDAKRRPQWKTENNVSDAHIEELRNDKFVNPKSIKVSTNADGKKVVSYKEYANHERTYEGITEEALAQMYADDAIEVLSATKRADDLYDVDVREGFGGLNRLGGYIPHFFHEYMIRLQTPDGKRTVIGSGRTEAEAVKIAEEWLKNNTIPDNAEIFIAPKSANFETLGMKEDAYAPIMGDKDFWKMQKLLAKNNDLTLAEAKEIVNGSIKQKNRHRFYGNFMHRTGAEGFEQNMQWVLRHYVNSAARYIAMETEFNYNAFNQSLP